MGGITFSEITQRSAWEMLEQQASFSAFQQSWPYGQLFQGQGRTVIRGQFLQGKTSLAICQLVQRSFLWGRLRVMIVQRGPVFLKELSIPEKQEIYLRLREYATAQKAILIITPEATEAEINQVFAPLKAIPLMTPYCPGIKDLTHSEADLRASLHGKWRNQLCKAEKMGLSVSLLDGGQALAELVQNVEEDRKRKKYKAFDAQTQLQLAALVGRKKRLIVVVKKGKDVLALAAFYQHGRCATYQMGWSNAQGRKLNAMNLTLWKAMIFLRKKGVEQLDLGGLNTDQAKGLAHFKARMGISITSLCGSWWLKN